MSEPGFWDYVWHYFSRVFCPWRPTYWRLGWETTGGTVPRCDVCGSAYGMCEHSGGPFHSDRLDSHQGWVPTRRRRYTPGTRRPPKQKRTKRK